MTVGEQLKRVREFLGLTQAEMCNGIVTDSFYSRVERNMSQISAVDLLNILDSHGIAIIDFFESFDLENELMGCTFWQIKLVYEEKDLEKLLSFKNQVASLKNKYQIRYQLMILTLEKKLNTLTKTEKDFFKRAILQVGKWDENNLFDLDLLLPLFPFHELKMLFSTILEADWQHKIEDEKLLVVLAKGSSDYLQRAYQEKEFEEVKKSISFIKKLPNRTSIFLAKLKTLYYKSLLENDHQKAFEIENILKQNGVKINDHW